MLAERRSALDYDRPLLRSAQMSLSPRWTILVIAFVPGLAAQGVTDRPLNPATVTIDTLLQTRGPGWTTIRSHHFVLHIERAAHDASATALLDSLEAAWDHATTLLATPELRMERAHVFVTASRTRFGGLMPPEARGLTTRLPGAGDVVVLISNDSVRAYTRHEVMHLVASHAWGPPSPGATWLAEGLSTFADGRCQQTTVIAAARDILNERPDYVAADIVKHFVELWRVQRGAAYVLAGSLVDYLWSKRGSAGVRRLWEGTDSLIDVGVLPGTRGALTAEWRAYVAGKAGAAPGIDATALQRAACG